MDHNLNYLPYGRKSYPSKSPSGLDSADIRVLPGAHCGKTPLHKLTPRKNNSARQNQQALVNDFSRLALTPKSTPTRKCSSTETNSDESVVPASIGSGSPQKRTAYVWNGELPPRNYVHPQFSCKLFVGGVPWDITEDALLEAFGPYGRCNVEWPGKEPRFSRSPKSEWPKGKVTGYVYMIFEQERSVKALLQDCSQEFGSAGEWYFRLRARRNQTTEIRQVQIIPWIVSDSTFPLEIYTEQDLSRTVFVGALHGMITAHVLYSIMKQLYGDVSYVTIDTDKYKYPIGSGRVCFRSSSAYFRAIESAFVEIKTSKFEKRVQIDPYLEDRACSYSGCLNQGPLFCRNMRCFRYFCPSCWHEHHSHPNLFSHRPLTRNGPRYPSELEEQLQYHVANRMFHTPRNTNHNTDVLLVPYSGPGQACGSASALSLSPVGSPSNIYAQRFEGYSPYATLPRGRFWDYANAYRYHNVHMY